ncbi:MAG: hypothetical protein BCS36_08560 [Desulfovibrio sp. MES5]|uniref:glycosyltransferase n=1 Tax=Desulfovibrio sp. MES5 TaxID=1899016 RepID=UPI000B9C805D|nr:glycosyltransferase [Desulfovibrio sp. MES5]OXS29832.1 MAG: hypothetical protein BCS36_08560 [Desulfovibrio sp. MES5]
MSSLPSDRPWLTVLLACLPEFSARPALDALIRAGGRGQVVLLLCEEAEREPMTALGREMVRSGDLRAFRCQCPQAGQNLWHVRNAASALVRTPWLLLLSSSVLLQENALPPLRRALETHRDLAGVNPFFLYPAGTGGPPARSDEPLHTSPALPRIAHMGTVVDCLGQQHYLYEGLPLGHTLARRERRFQLAHTAALLLRTSDVAAAGGFNPSLDSLADVDFCLRLGALLHQTAGGGAAGAFGSIPVSLARLGDYFDSWQTCGLWNSLLQRERIEPGVLHPDYAAHVSADGLEYGCTDWLWQGPCPQPGSWVDAGKEPESSGAGEPGTGFPLEAWLRWRWQPQPDTLLGFLHALTPHQRTQAVQMCRDLPVSLPYAHSWYASTARNLLACSHRGAVAPLVHDAQRWLERAEDFRRNHLHAGMRALQAEGVYDSGLDDCPASFDAWVELVEPALQSGQDCTPDAAQFDLLHTGADWPAIAVVMPVYNPRPDHLRAALDSVLAQEYPHWQLCIADDASTKNEIPEILRSYAADDKRLRLVLRGKNGHISRASNSALELVDAPWTGFLDHDDLLTNHALSEVASLVRHKPDLGLMYSDEDKLDSRGVRRTPVFRADFDPWTCFTGHFSVYATKELRAAGGFRTGFEGSQDFDLSLRVIERLAPGRIAHMPRILYHWRVHDGSTSGSLGAKPYVLEATRRALEESVRRRGFKAEAVPTALNNFFVLRHEVDPRMRCSAVLLAADSRPVQAGLWEELEKLAGTLDLEVLCQPLSNDAAEAFRSMPTATFAGARLLPPPEGKENGDWHAACNGAASAASGQVLLFLDARLSPLPGSLPGQLAALALQENVGAVGGTLWRGNRLWHAGLMPDVTGLPFALHRGAHRDLLSSICWGQLLLTRRALAAPEQAMAVRRAVFLEHGGYDIAMGPWAGADLGLRLAAAGMHSLSCPWGQWHVPLQPGKALENVAWAEDVQGRQRITPQTRESFLARWGGIVRGSGLRNALLHAAPDQSWALTLKIFSEHFASEKGCML